MSLSALRVTVIVFPGSNCDRDMMVAIEKLAGRRPAGCWPPPQSAVCVKSWMRFKIYYVDENW